MTGGHQVHLLVSPFLCTIAGPMRVDLNADVGETSLDADAALMGWISSASVAAGVHAGDPSILRTTIRLAREHGVAVGAHPGYPDRSSGGRGDLRLPPSAVEDLVLYQVAAVAGVARAEGVRLRHVKLHGALYNTAARDPELAAAAVRAVAAFDKSLIVFGPPGSALLEAAAQHGLRTAAEAFADRAYNADGSLVARTSPGALITDPLVVVPRAVRMIREAFVQAIDGTEVRVPVETLCVHSDTPGAAVLARQIRAGLEQAGVTVSAPRAPRAGRGAAPSR